MSSGLESDPVLRAIAASPPVPPPERRLQAGEVLAGRFEIERLAGHGGMGHVYRARDLEGGPPVAIKVTRRPGRDAARFAQEARLLATVTHPAIVRHVADGELADGQRFLAMEWLEGEDLARRLARGGLRPGESVTLARLAAEGLAAAHALGILHRDVKPSNLFLVDGDPAKVKLLDFGVARLTADGPMLTRAGDVLGTRGYMAPEQAAGSRDLDGRADVFALGCVLFECLAGRPAFFGERPAAALAKVLRQEAPRLRSHLPALPAALDELVARMLAKERADRPASAAAVAAELAALGDCEPGPRVVILADGAGDPGRAAELMRPFGGEAAELADGTLLVTLPAEGAAAARALREAQPDAHVAVADGADVGTAIDRAATILGGLRQEPASAEVDLPIVERERFRIEGEIARGGMGRILAAQDLRLRRPVALKELLASDSASLARRFAREVSITARLQHPGIVGVHEAGRWPRGEPFFVMRRVEGRSLEAAIAAARGREERLALLPHAVAAAAALAYAHSRRIIHRDLKPANILVGAYGETVVIDWGLAKELDAPDRDSTASMPPSGASGGGTVAGAILGTPSYMAPEQARGESVDERADVYALGAMLYHILTGRVPYDGPGVDDIIDKASGGERAPLRAVAPGLPEDLVAIVEKAMAFAPARRYASAEELAGDLRRYQAGQLVGAHRYSTWQLVRRWLRRHRVAVTVAAALLAILAVTVTVAGVRVVREKDRADGLRVVAERSQGESEGLMDFMLGDLRDRLAPLGKLELLDVVARKAMAYYDGRPAPAGGEDLGRRALAIANIGDVVLTQGHTAEALAAQRNALALRLRRAARAPGEDRAQRDVVSSRQRIAELLVAQGDSRGALAELGLALVIAQRMADGDPASAWWLQALSETHRRVGSVLSSQGDLPGALTAFRVAMALATKLAARDPESSVARRLLGVTHSRIGAALHDQGDSAGAEAAYRAAIAAEEPLLARDPGNATLQQSLAAGYEDLGSLLERKGDLPGALAQARLSFAIRARLAERDPTNSELQRSLATAHSRIGELLSWQGDSAAALAALEEAMAIRVRLAELDPRNRDWQRAVSVAHERIGRVALQAGNLPRALASYRAGLAITERLIAGDPANTTWMRDSRVLHSRIADVLGFQGDGAGALAERQTTRAISEALAARDPSNATWQYDLYAAHVGVADRLLERGDLAGALAAYRTALPIAERLVARDPRDTATQRALAVGHQHLGQLLDQQHDLAGALAEQRASLAILDRLVALDPTNATWRQDQAIAHGWIGGLLMKQKDLDGAAAASRAALAIHEELAATHPGDASMQRGLAASLSDLASVQDAQKQPKEARANLRRALAILERMAAADPSNAQNVHDVAMLRRALGGAREGR